MNRADPSLKNRWLARIDRFFFATCDPSWAPVLRIMFAVMLIIVSAVWLRDAEHWFSDQGVLTRATAHHLNNYSRLSLLDWLPSTGPVVTLCLWIMLIQSACLLLGLYSRFQMICLFIWIVSFQHRNPLICDGEDTLFRWFAFLMIFLPLDCRWSIASWLHWSTPVAATSANAWALRLMQIQMTLIYASATWNKLWGETWQNGTALYFVSHMNDHFGRMPYSTRLYDSLWLVQLQTWGVLVVEAVLPILLWVPRLRTLAILLGIGLHLGIELTMHLFLFEWIMIFGLLTFFAVQKPKKVESLAG